MAFKKAKAAPFAKFGKKASSGSESDKPGPLAQKLGKPTVKIQDKFEAKGAKGNVETGFIQDTQKKATGAMMGKKPPSMKSANKGTKGAKAKGAKKSFGMPPGRYVF